MPYANKISGIYKLTNRITGMSYIGQSRNIKSRWAQIKCLGLQGSDNQPINKAIWQYGWENFEPQILIVVDNQEDLDRYENDCICIYNTLHPYGYNHRNGGMTGYTLEQSTIEKVREKSKGKPRGWSPEGKLAVERTQFKKGQRGFNVFAIKTDEEAFELKQRISEGVKQAWIRGDFRETKTTKERDAFIASGDVIRCNHCEVYRKSTEFEVHLNGNRFKTCNKCADGQRERLARIRKQ